MDFLFLNIKLAQSLEFSCFLKVSGKVLSNQRAHCYNIYFSNVCVSMCVSEKRSALKNRSIMIFVVNSNAKMLSAELKTWPDPVSVSRRWD